MDELGGRKEVVHLSPGSRAALGRPFSAVRIPPLGRVMWRLRVGLGRETEMRAARGVVGFKGAVGGCGMIQTWLYVELGVSPWRFRFRIWGRTK